jgi:hypothetical protein
MNDGDLYTSSFTRISDLITSVIDDEVVILNIEKGEYYSFNKVGSEIWQFLETTSTFEQIIDYLISNYDIDKETCITETSEYLMKMINCEIILRSDK